MPNGDPDWHLTKLPQLERFFAPLTEEIRQFALTHNMHIERYYHQAPDWRLDFTPPEGGNAAIHIRCVNDDTFMLYNGSYIDDHDAATRSIKHSESPKYRVGNVRLTDVLFSALLEIVSWRKGEWSQVARGYDSFWHRYTREEFENMSPRWPKVRLPEPSQ